ncbi:FMN-linked oxidoreductase [Peniophora sp. CONT]|nr:FMN-linked oxidoreductase [Peniophora sp. CONT]
MPINTPVPGAYQFFPLNTPQPGATLNTEKYPQNHHIPPLFRPITLRGVTFPNRIFVSPMCQYSSDNGHATDWHLVHLGGFASRGAGAIIVEATAVVPEGRISPEDAGLWTDSQIAPIKRCVDFAHGQGVKIGIQLAHAGRKSSVQAPYIYAPADTLESLPKNVAGADEHGWPDSVFAPSEIPWSGSYAQPKALTVDGIKTVIAAHVASTKRAVQAGFDFIEIHGAHGYLHHSFMSPLSNTRTDQYGGSYENRTRFVKEAIEAVRGAMPEEMPLFCRLSASDWAPEVPEKDQDGTYRQWGPEQTTRLAKELSQMGVDLVDVSSAGNYAKQKITVSPGYQVPFSEAIKKAHPDLVTGTVGMILEPKQANEVIEQGRADVVLLAREFLRNPNFVLTAAMELGVAVKPANQYERAWTRVLRPRDNDKAADEQSRKQSKIDSA